MRRSASRIEEAAPFGSEGEECDVESPGRRDLLVSRTWIQAAVLVFLVGFFILGLLAYRTYMAEPPVPDRVLDRAGAVVYTGRDISKGQQVFLHNGLMEYGSAFGDGAYLGPDYTADYLRRSSLIVRRAYGGPRSAAAAQRTIADMRANRYDEGSSTLLCRRPRRSPTGSWCPTTGGSSPSRRPRTACAPRRSPTRTQCVS